MGYCLFSSLGHDTIDCIVIGKGASACSRGPRYGQQPCDTAGLRSGQAAAYARTA